jgi:hypothetical protein
MVQMQDQLAVECNVIRCNELQSYEKGKRRMKKREVVVVVSLVRQGA